MADWNRREITIQHIEYTLRLGTPIGEARKAMHAAGQEWERLNPGQTPAEDWATVTADDEHLIIRIEVKEYPR